MLWTLFSFFFSLIFERVTEPSTEQAKEWFKNGHGYFANLPEEEKRKMIDKDSKKRPKLKRWTPKNAQS